MSPARIQERLARPWAHNRIIRIHWTSTCQMVCWAPQTAKATASWSFRWEAASPAGEAGVRTQQIRAAPSTVKAPTWKRSAANL